MKTVKLTRDEVERVCGRVSDELALDILETGGTVADLEVASQWAAGADDVMGKTGHPLVGPAADIYEILVREQGALEEERRA